MRTDDRQNETCSGPTAVGDANIDRLLSQAYQPETPDAGFVARVEQALAAAGEARRQAASAHRDSANPGQVVLPSGEILALRPWQILLGWAAAILVLAGTIALIYRSPEKAEPAKQPGFVRDGDVIWHQGEAFVAADVNPAKSLAQPAGSALNNAPIAKTSPKSSSQRTPNGITARLAPTPAKPKVAKVGETIATTSTQRRVALPDGSLLHLDRNTAALIEGPRQVRLLSGQAFVEVRPTAGRDLDQRFIVHTPHRDLTALGTKFAVSVDRAGTDLFVTQGKVQATGAEQAVAAGQRLAAAQNVPAAAPRATYALDWAKDSIASAAGRLVPASQYAGGSLVAKGPEGQETSLSLRKYHIDVHIEDGFARTTIDQTYFNREYWRMEGTFFFPLPPDASLSRLAMYVGPTLMEGGMVERDYGRQVFETIKYRSLDPALLEWVDGSTFKMRVFPLEGRQEKRIILSYTQRLPTAYGRTQYRFPAGHSLESVRDWSLQVLLKGGASTPWHCDSHSLTPRRTGSDLVLMAAAHDVKADADVALALDEPQIAEADAKTESSAAARFSTFEQEGWRYLMLRYRPRLGESPERQRRDWVFLFEASADRDPVLARAQIEIIRGILQNTEHDDTFNIVTANTRAAVFSDQPRTATAENIAAAVQFMENARLIGALDLQKALAAAKPLLAATSNGMAHPALVHVGSGIPVLGQRQIDKLLADLPSQAAYVGIGVGKRWNRAFMRQAAARTGGYFTQVNPDEPLAWRAMELLSTLNAPRLLDMKVEALEGPRRGEAGLSATEQPTFLLLEDSLADGEELCAVTRLPVDQPLPARVQISGRVVGRIGNPSYESRELRRELPIRLTQSVGEAGQAGYLPRTWAKQEIDRLVAADAAKNRESIVALSKAMYVMSPFTSLLVLENEAMYQEFKVDRGRKDDWAMYPCPERIEVVQEPLAAPDPARLAAPPVKPKPSVEEILSSILVRVPRSLLRWPNDVDDSGTYTGANWLDEEDIENDARRVALMLNKPVVWVRPNRLAAGLSAPGVFSSDLEIPNLRRRWTGRQPDFDSLMDLILSTVRPESWREAGGPYTHEAFPGNLSLVISQTQEVHEHVSELLEQMRLHSSLGFVPRVNFTDNTSLMPVDFIHDSGSMSDGDTDDMLLFKARRAVPWRGRFHAFRRLAAPSAAEQRIVRELTQPTSIDFDEMPLKDAVQFLQDRHGINIEISQKKLEEAGVPLETPISRALRGVTLKSALKLMLHDLGLSYVVRDESVVITSKEDADAYLVTRVYPVGDLIVPSAYWSESERAFLERGFDYWERANVGLNADMRRAIEDGMFLRRERLSPFAREQFALGSPNTVVARDRDDALAAIVARSDELAQATGEWNRYAERNRQLLAQLAQYRTALRDSALPLNIAQPHVSGLVTAVHDRERMVEINLGTDHGLKEGVRLDVYRLGNTLAATQYLGQIRLFKMDKTQSVGSLVGGTFRAAIRPDDYVTTATRGLSRAEGELLFTQFSGRLARSADHRDLLYQPPGFNFSGGVFSDLLAFAPGMHTLASDVASIVDAEADLPGRPRQGSIDPAARALIDQARQPEWRNVTWKDERDTLAILYDGRGRCRYERATIHGLKEQVLCDGAHLWHLYPELGVGARRAVDRHQRAALPALVPWLVLPTEDYARGADVKLLSPSRVAIVPHDIDTLDTEQSVDEPTPKPKQAQARRPYLEERLSFDTAGKAASRVVERQIVLMPEGKVLITTHYAADGLVSVRDGDSKQLGEVRLTVGPVASPDLQPDKSLVILPLPVRSRDHVLAKVAQAKDKPEGAANVAPSAKGPNADKASRPVYDDWSDDDVLRLLAARLWEYPHQSEEIVAGRFFARGDRRLGFYTLLLLAGRAWRYDQPEVIDGRSVAMNPLADHPGSPLAHYLARQSWLNATGNDRHKNPTPRLIEPQTGGPRGTFFNALSELRDAHYERLAEKARRKSEGKSSGVDDADARHGEAHDAGWYVNENLAYAQACPSPSMAWAVLKPVRGWIAEMPEGHRLVPYRTLASRYELLEHGPLAYAARYERAACYHEIAQYASGHEREAAADESRRLFTQLFRETVGAGQTPALDPRFFAALLTNQADELVREGAESLVKSGRHAHALALAWQCRHLSREGAAEGIVDLVLRKSLGAERALVTAAAIEFYEHGNNFARANALMESLLADERLARLPSLWSLAAVLAEKQGQQLRAADRLEQAISRVHQDGLDQDALAKVSEAYGDLMTRYGRVASALAGLEGPATEELVARVTRVADRRRTIEADPTDACWQTAELLRRLGQRDAAWDYLTTPLALRPGETEPWARLGESLKIDGDNELADRAFAAAFEIEGSNPTHLWSRAQLSQQRGRFDEARAFYRQIAAGTWPPQHAELQKQARKILGQ